MSEEKTEIVQLTDLSADPKNARVHNGKNLDAIERSLEEFGPARSMVIDGEGVIRAGGGTFEAAKRAGITKVLVVEAEDDTIIAVRKRFESDDQAAAYAIADNRTSDLSTWDAEQLRETVGQLQDLDDPELLGAIGFSEEALDKLVSAGAAVVLNVEPPPAAPEGLGETPNATCPKCGFAWHQVKKGKA